MVWKRCWCAGQGDLYPDAHIAKRRVWTPVGASDPGADVLPSEAQELVVVECLLSGEAVLLEALDALVKGGGRGSRGEDCSACSWATAATTAAMAAPCGWSEEKGGGDGGDEHKHFYKDCVAQG